MAYTKRFVKHPDEIIDYDIDFTSWLLARDDTIVAYDTDIDDGLTLVNSITFDSIVRLYLGGGTPGEQYIAAAEITTEGGRRKRGQIQVRVQGRPGPDISVLGTVLLGNDPIYLDDDLIVLQ